MTEKSKPVGVISDRDIFYRWTRGVPFAFQDLENLPIVQIMRTHLPVVTPEINLTQVVKWMSEFGTSAILSRTIDGDWGIITESDLLAALDKLLSKEQMRQELLREGETALASPLVQKMMEMIAQMGI